MSDLAVCQIRKRDIPVPLFSLKIQKEGRHPATQKGPAISKSRPRKQRITNSVSKDLEIGERVRWK